MRLWTLHPRHLDRQGLTGAWREALLAQAVLAGRTRGYRDHPQLLRFRATDDPIRAITSYLWRLAEEADRRGYTFRSDKLLRPLEPSVSLTLAQGQLDYEWAHLCRKVEQRDPPWFRAHLAASAPRPHPMFTLIPGPVAEWEIV